MTKSGTKKVFLITVLVTVLMALTLASGAFAQSSSPSGAAPGAPIRVQVDPALQADLEAGRVPAHVCMTDAFGFLWDLNVSVGAGMLNLSGTVDALTGFLWNASGTVTKSGPTWTWYFRADNPQADGCASGWTDYFEYSGGNPPPSLSGTWVSYCSGSPIGSGTWTGTIYNDPDGVCP